MNQDKSRQASHGNVMTLDQMQTALPTATRLKLEGEYWEGVMREHVAIAVAARQGGDVQQAPGEAPQSGGDSRIAPTKSVNP